MRGLFWGIIVLCLLAACYTDCRTCSVYNVTWWISGTAAVILLVMGRNSFGVKEATELGIFVFLQLFVFSGMYGKADSYAFSVCAIAGTSAGMGLKEYLMHMLAAFCLLALIQGMCRNIDKHGNLKHPVPFLPYITLAFFALLWYHYTCSLCILN